MAEEGWSWRLSHSGAPKGATAGARAARHTLVIFDARAEVPELGALRFSRPDLRGAGVLGTGLFDTGLAQDTVTAWQVGQQLTPNAVTLGSWDERQLAGVAADARSVAEHGEVPVLEDYRGHGERRHTDGRESQPTIVGSGAKPCSRHASAQYGAKQLRETPRRSGRPHRQSHRPACGLHAGPGWP